MERDQHVFSNEQIYTVNDSAPREQRTITAKASTNAAAYETHPGESLRAENPYHFRQRGNDDG